MYNFTQTLSISYAAAAAKLCPTLSNPMDCSLPGSSVHGIFQARVLEWSAIAFSIGHPAATAAANSLQSCLTLCDSKDSSPLGSSVPGILQARTLEWVAISFSFGSQTLYNLELASTISTCYSTQCVISLKMASNLTHPTPFLIHSFYLLLQPQVAHFSLQTEV